MMESAREDFFCSTLKCQTDKELNIRQFVTVSLRRGRGDGQVFRGVKMGLAQQAVCSVIQLQDDSEGLK